MAEFTASPIVAAGDPNVLWKAQAAGDAQYTNQLLNQGRQLDLSNANMEQVARVSAALLNEPDLAKRAELYPRYVGSLQSQGYAMHAPATLPDESTLQMLTRQGVPVADQIKYGFIQPPGLADALAKANAPLPGQPGYGGAPSASTGTTAAPSLTIPARGSGGPGASASAPTEWLPYFEEASKATGIPVDLLIAQARQESGFNPNNVGTAGEIGLFQIKPSTARAPAGMAGVDPASITGPDNVRNNIMFGAQYLKAQMGGGDPTNPAVQAAALHRYNGGGDPDYVAHVFRYRPTLAPSDPNAAVTSYTPPTAGATTASATPTAAPAGGDGAPGRTQVASTAPVALPAATTETQPPTAAAPPSTAAPTAAAPAPIVAPASTAQPAPSTGTGTQSPQFQAALEMNRRATALETQFPYSPQAKAQAASLRAQAALYMQADSVSVDPATGIQTKQLTGERLNAAAPNAHYVWNEQQGAYVDTTGVHPPVTPPSPRLTIAPGGDVLQSKPGGGIAVVKPADPGAIQTQEAAKTSGAAAGTATGKLTGELADQGRTAASAIGNIDYGMSQVAKAKAGGINTGYFAPWLSTVASVAKSLGVPTEAIGVDPNAVGNIQTAKKTLAVVSGAILQQILGPGSQVTDAKIQHFIAAQPGIETDPAALERVLNWARSQFVYEREMAAQGMQDASATGVLPTNWQAKYYHEHGFAPIYNPGTGEMQQPDGQAPSREPPRSASGPPTVSSDADYHALPSGTVFLDPNGKRRTKP